MAKATEESQRPYVFNFDTLSDYTHEKYVEERMSKVVVAGQVGDEKEKSLELLLDIISDAIDLAHQKFSPSSSSAKALKSFYDSIDASSSSSSSSSSAKRVDAISADEDWAFDKYMRQKESTLATMSALLLKCVDSSYSWEFGWLLAAEARKLSESERLNLILSRTVPAPTGTQYLNACREVIKEQEKNRKKLPRGSITISTFDNISSAYGYQHKASRGGIQQSKKRNPIATAWTIHHYTRSETSPPGNELNPMQMAANDPKNWPISWFTDKIPEAALTPSDTEMKLLEDEWRGSLLERIDEVIVSGSFDSLPPKPTLKKTGKSKGGGGSNLKCYYCKVEWKCTKRTCYELPDKASSDTSLLAAGEYERLRQQNDFNVDGPVGCSERIRGPVTASNNAGEVSFDPKQTRKYRAFHSFAGSKGIGVGAGRKRVVIKLEVAADSASVRAAQHEPFKYDRTPDTQEIIFVNPGSKEGNSTIINTIGERLGLPGFIDSDIKEPDCVVAFVCSDGGADFGPTTGGSDRSLFGPHGNLIPVIAAGHEWMTFLKCLMKIAFFLGADVFAEVHMWKTLRAKLTLLGCSDTHKACAFLLKVCRPSMETSFVREWLAGVKEHKGDDAFNQLIARWNAIPVDETAVAAQAQFKQCAVEDMWTWLNDIHATENLHFSNHAHFWIKSLGALALLQKGNRSHMKTPVHAHEFKRAAQKFLGGYLFSLGHRKWGPLLLRDWKVIDHCINKTLRDIYLELVRMDTQGFDFLEEQDVRNIGRNMMLSGTKLSFQIGCLIQANGSKMSDALSKVLRIRDRGKRDRTEVSYSLDVEGCAEVADTNRAFYKGEASGHVYDDKAEGAEALKRKNEVRSVDMQRIIPKQSAPIAMYKYGREGMLKFVKDGKAAKFPEDILPKRLVIKAVKGDADDNEESDEEV